VTTTDDPRDEGYLRLARELPGFVADDNVLPFVPDPPAEKPGEVNPPDSRESCAVIRDEGAMAWLD
jgi:hypothetical protein